jgi:hypothetical protein
MPCCAMDLALFLSIHQTTEQSLFLLISGWLLSISVIICIDLPILLMLFLYGPLVT